MRSTDILIVDDEIGIRESIADTLQDEGYGVALAENAAAARALRRETRPAMVLLDIWMPDCDGITLLKEWAKDGLLNMPVVMMSGHGTIDTAVEATKIGALDYLEKPISLQRLLNAVQRALKYSKMQENSNLSMNKLGKSAVMQKLQQTLNDAAGKPGNIILLGEAGSPFLDVAKFFHHSQNPWIAPAPEQWADTAQDWVRRAHNGVLYLGNLAEFDKNFQSTLLSAFSRAGHYNVRIISVSHQPPHELLARHFNPQLLHELSGMLIHIPPLREQFEDLPQLVNQIMVQLVESRQVRMVQFSNAAMTALRQYPWPGNLEQLKLIVKSLALSASKGTVDAQQVSQIIDQQKVQQENCGDLDFDLPLRDLREEVERRYFEYHICQENNNMSQVAQKVGLERTHLYRKLKQLGIQTTKRGSSKE